MIELTNSVSQTVAAGSPVLFDTARLHTGDGECWRQGSGYVKLRAKCGTYEVNFSANISGGSADTSVSLAFYIGEEQLQETVMTVTPSAANALNNVSKSALIRNCCDDYSRIRVVNIGSANVTVANPILFVRRLS